MQAAGTDDLDLLRLYRDNGDQQAFATMVDRHLPLVFGTAYRELCHEQDAQDICQKVFTKLATKGRHERIRHISSWLFIVTRQEVVSMKRSEGRRRERETKAAELAAMNAPAAEAAGLPSEPHPDVQMAFAQLSEVDQKALFLRFHDELDFREIGTALGVSQRAAQKRLYRAMDKLKTLLARRGVKSSTAVAVGTLFSTACAPAPPTDLSSVIAKTALVEAAAVPLPLMLPSWLTPSIACLGLGAGALLATATFFFTTLAPSDGQGGQATNEIKGEGLAATGISTERVEAREPSGDRIAVDDIEAIYQLPDVERAAALVRLEGHLKQESDVDYFTDLMSRWTRLDAPRCADALFLLVEVNADNGDGERDALLVGQLAIPLDSWTAAAPNAVADWISAKERSRAESVAFPAVVGALGLREPTKAFELLAARGGTDALAYEVLAEAVTADGIEKACAFLVSLPDVEKETAASVVIEGAELADASADPKTRLIAAALPRLYENDAESIADWLTQLPSDDEAPFFAGAFAKRLAEDAPRLAAKWAVGLPATSRMTALPEILETWARAEPASALKWAVASTDAPFEIAERAFDRWTEGDPAAAAQWLEPFATNADAAPWFGTAVDSLDPVKALAWVEGLPTGGAKERALQHTFFALGRTDPATGQAAIRNVAPAVRQSAAMALAEGMFAGSGRRAVSAWESTNADTGHADIAAATRAAQVGILAAIDPEVVADQVLEMESGPEKDLALGALINCTYRRSSEHTQHAQRWARQIRDASSRQEWLSRIKDAEATKPWEQTAILPERLAGSFDAQSFADFHQRLELLSSLPPRTQR